MFASLLLLGLLIFFLIYLLKPQRPKNFPPGPPTLPVLGNLLHLSTDDPLNDFERLRKSYGDVFSVFIGPQPAVVINGLKAMKEALVIKGMDFAGRPQDMFVNHVTQDIGGVMENYGPVWREHRRFALMTLRNFGLGKKSMEERIHEEIQHTIKTLENSIGLYGNCFEYAAGTKTSVRRIGVKCFTDNAKMTNGPWAMMYDSLPMVRNLPLPFRNAFKNYETCKQIALDIMKEHKETKVSGEPRDFVDCYLDELEKKTVDLSFSEDRLAGYSLDLYFAGTDTTSNTLLTGFLYLMGHPHIQGMA
ncbi:hypothetical protein OJAV_G00058560 [Oryzias javanicus]|uniref:Cytochrome P450 n=1 Tax=Oryzias javanicus TaxID=123683 RepID=A0A437DB28_ORYJA|nr:hypothetical protein OJAV_G00058560 [Oryzias javanicus]